MWGRALVFQIHRSSWGRGAGSAAVPPSDWIVAALGPALFIGAGIALGGGWRAVLAAPFLLLAVEASVIDLRERRIPNALVYPGFLLFAAAVAIMWASGVEVSLPRAAVGFLAYGGGLFLLASLWPDGMGMGDVKLAALTGLVLGALGWAYIAVAVAVAILSAGLGAVGVLLATRKRKSTIPFGPFLTVGAIVSGFWAHPIASWYLSSLS